MDLIGRLKQANKMFSNLSREDLKAYQMLFIILLLIDVFGVWWYLDAKKIGMAGLLVCGGFLALFLILERRLPEEKMCEPTEKEVKIKKLEDELADLKGDKKEDKKEPEDKKEEPTGLGGDFFSQSPEEYEDRLNKAISG